MNPIYDYTADAVKRALRSATVGGHHPTGPASAKAEAFLQHCLDGTNHVTGAKGSPLDFIAFHAKGRPEYFHGRVVMNLGKQLRDISKGFEIVSSYLDLIHLRQIRWKSEAHMDEDQMLNRFRAGLMGEMENINLYPREDFDHLSSVDMDNILYFTFDEVSPVGFRDHIDSKVLDQIPFLSLALEYFAIIKAGGRIKLTKRGNLPRKVCLDLYATGIIKEDYIEKGYIKLNKEGDLAAIQNVRIIGLLGGLTKKRKNEISFTARGEKLLGIESRKDLLEVLFRTNCQKFNLGFHDGYSEHAVMQDIFGYTLYLLLRYGDEKRPAEFYAEKNLMAFPNYLNHFRDGWSSQKDQFRTCYEIRVLERFLKYYDFVEYDNKRSPLSSIEPVYVKTTEIFKEVFELKVDKFKFRKSAHQA